MRNSPSAHDAETRANLVTELGLDLIEVQRRLTVALHIPLRTTSVITLLVGRPDDEVALVAILETKQLGDRIFPNVRFLPKARQGRLRA